MMPRSNADALKESDLGWQTSRHQDFVDRNQSRRHHPLRGRRRLRRTRHLHLRGVAHHDGVAPDDTRIVAALPEPGLLGRAARARHARHLFGRARDRPPPPLRDLLVHPPPFRAVVFASAAPRSGLVALGAAGAATVGSDRAPAADLSEAVSSPTTVGDTPPTRPQARKPPFAKQSAQTHTILPSSGR